MAHGFLGDCVDYTNVNILVMVIYFSFPRFYHWEILVGWFMSLMSPKKLEAFAQPMVLLESGVTRRRWGLVKS